jgi:tetratricopeptide (TPR) repeat protein
LFFALTLNAQQSDGLAEQSQRAKELMAHHEYDKAIPIYEQLMKAMPGDPGLLFNLGLAEHMAGHEQESVVHFEEVLKTQPKFVPALVSLAGARLALDEPQLAIAPLEKTLAQEPGNQEARGMLASAFEAAGRPEQAADEYRKLTAATPSDPRAWSGLGTSYEAVATRAFDRLQKIDPQSPYVSALIADTRVQRRQYRSAFFFYQQTLKRLPKLHGIHAALATVYRKTDHPDWADQEETKERLLPPPDCHAHPHECDFIAGHDLQAITFTATAKPTPEELFWQAKAANELALQAFFQLGQLPPSVELHRLKAEIARAQNEDMESVKEWRAALQLSPGDPDLERELIASLFMARDYRSALAEATKILQIDPHSPVMNFTAGDSLLRLEEPEKAVPYLKAALAGDPKMLPADASLGLALARLGKNTEAVPHLEKSLQLDDDGSLHYQLARAYQAGGEAEKARTTMEKYQEIVKRNQEQKDEVAREAQIVSPHE